MSVFLHILATLGLLAVGAVIVRFLVEIFVVVSVLGLATVAVVVAWNTAGHLL